MSSLKKHRNTFAQHLKKQDYTAARNELQYIYSELSPKLMHQHNNGRTYHVDTVSFSKSSIQQALEQGRVAIRTKIWNMLFLAILLTPITVLAATAALTADIPNDSPEATLVPIGVVLSLTATIYVWYRILDRRPLILLTPKGVSFPRKGYNKLIPFDNILDIYVYSGKPSEGQHVYFLILHQKDQVKPIEIMLYDLKEYKGVVAAGCIEAYRKAYTAGDIIDTHK